MARYRLLCRNDFWPGIKFVILENCESHYVHFKIPTNEKSIVQLGDPVGL